MSLSDVQKLAVVEYDDTRGESRPILRDALLECGMYNIADHLLDQNHGAWCNIVQVLATCKVNAWMMYGSTGNYALILKELEYYLKEMGH